jgi:HEAT repeat protein
VKYLILVVSLFTFVSLANAQEAPDNQEPATKEPATPVLKLSPKEVVRQVKLLGSRFYGDRTEAQITLARTGEAAIPHLKDILESENILQRMSAVELLGRLRRPEAILLILKMLKDSSPMVHKSADKALRHYGSGLLADLNQLMEEGKVNEKELPESIITRLYRKTLEELFSKVDTGGQYPGMYNSIVKLAPKAIPALFLMLDDALEGRRKAKVSAGAIINALGDIKSKKIIERLETLMQNPRASGYRQMIVISLAKLGNDKYYKEMLEPLLKQAEGQGGSSVYNQLAMMHHRVYNYEESEKWFRRAAEATGGGMHRYNLACALAMGKKLDKAVEELKTAAESGSVQFDWMVKDKELDPIREHPGYIEILKKHCPQYLPEKYKEKEENKEQEDSE